VQNFVQSLANAVTRNDPQARKNAAEKSAPTRIPAPATPVVDPGAVPGLNPEILGTIGEEFAHDLTQAIELILHAVAHPRTYAADLSRTHFLIEGLRRKAMGMQQISRLAQNRLRQSHEKLMLHSVTQSMLDDHKSEFTAQGLIITTHFKPVEVIVDPGLLFSMVAAALGWVTEFGTVVRISSGMKNWPKHGQLVFSAAQGVRTQADIDHKTVVNQSIAWHLVQHTAQAMGVGLEMNETVHERSIVLEFPRTVVALEGMTMMEMDANEPSSESFGSVSSNFMAGHHILLVANDYRLYVQIREICKNLSLMCDHAPNVEAAERMCEREVPHLLICEELLADERFDALLEDLHRHSPGFPTIMITEESYGFALSDWSGSNKSRISRDQIQDQLSSALTIEMSRSL
jgi:hypothetical protein